MKRSLVITAFMLSYVVCCAQVKAGHPAPQNPNVAKENSTLYPGSPARDNAISGSRAYEIIVTRVDDEEVVKSRNSAIRGLMQEQNSRGFFDTALGAALKTGYGSLATQKAVNLTSNLVDYTVNFISTAVKNHKERFNNWYKTAKSYRQFSKTLSQQQTTGDFYAAPSNNGAFDPENIMFDGIGCSSYFSSKMNNGQMSKHDEYCYIFCKLRTDSVGMKSIVNHSKFLLEVDSIYFRPNLCDIPSNVLRRVTRDTDFFEKQTDLNVTLNAKIYSSWFNEGIMLQRDQLLGSFDVVMKIDKSDCVLEDGEWVFKYSKKLDGDSYMPSTGTGEERLHRSEISISGESFIVPRSFSMDANNNNSNPIWGTGEYHVDLTLSETCNLNTEYYYANEYKQSNNNSIGNGKAVAFASLPGEKYFDKKIWQAEWVEMKKLKSALPNGNDKSDTFLNGAWSTVVATMKGSSWTTTFLSPLMTAVTAEEAKELNKFLGLDAASASKGQSATQQAVSRSGSKGNGATSTPGGGAPNGGNGGAMPQNPPVK